MGDINAVTTSSVQQYLNSPHRMYTAQNVSSIYIIKENGNIGHTESH